MPPSPPAPGRRGGGPGGLGGFRRPDRAPPHAPGPGQRPASAAARGGPGRRHAADGGGHRGPHPHRPPATAGGRAHRPHRRAGVPVPAGEAPAMSAGSTPGVGWAERSEAQQRVADGGLRSSAQPTTHPLLEAESLALRIAERWLCCEFSLRLAAGECLVVLGPNGAGKTTLLHTLAGLRPPTVGRVRLEGREYAAWPAQAAARVRALLPQQPPDHFNASVLETVLVGRHPHLPRWGWEGPEDLRRAREALAAVDMAGMEGRDVLSLSGGERQRVAIAAVLAQAPRLFLLDEPTNHLDLRHQITTLDLFRRLADEGRGVVMVLHDINLAARYADQVILLDGRGGVLAGPRDEILQAERLSQAFGHPLRGLADGARQVFLPL